MKRPAPTRTAATRRTCLRAALALCAAWAVACAEPAARTAPVGRLTRSYADSARTDWDGVGPRPMATTVWYPAAAGSVESEWVVDVFRFGRSAPDAEFADGVRRPLIVLSHGTGGSAAQHAWLAEALAAEGFVVAGVNHHGNTGAEPSYRPAGFVLPWERALDLSALIDRLAADPVIGSHVDTTRVGAAGFSLGGYTVLALAGARLDQAEWRRPCTDRTTSIYCALPPEAPFTLADVDSLSRTDAPFQQAAARQASRTHDARVRAVFAMAPALAPGLDTASVRALAIPLHVVLGEHDDQVPPQPVVDLFAQHQPAAVVDTRPGALHYSFLAECTWRGRLLVRALCTDGGRTRARLHHDVARDAVGFFAAQLGAVPR